MRVSSWIWVPCSRLELVGAAGELLPAAEELSSAWARASMLSVWASCSARNSRRRRERSRAHFTLIDWKACTVALTIRWAVAGSPAVYPMSMTSVSVRRLTSRLASSPSMTGSRPAMYEGGGLDAGREVTANCTTPEIHHLAVRRGGGAVGPAGRARRSRGTRAGPSRRWPGDPRAPATARPVENSGVIGSAACSPSESTTAPATVRLLISCRIGRDRDRWSWG